MNSRVPCDSGQILALPALTLVTNGWRRPWVCADASQTLCRALCDSRIVKSPYSRYSHACFKRLAPPRGLCRSLRMRHKLSAAYEFTRSVESTMAKSPDRQHSYACLTRRPWVCAAVSGCGTGRHELPMNSRVPCDAAIAKSPRCQHSYACLKRLVPPVGLCRSLRTRHELFAAYEFTRSVRFSRGKIPALPALIRLSQKVGATRGFVPQSPDVAQAMAKSTHGQHSYACLKRLAPPMGVPQSPDPPPMNSRVPCE